MSAPFNVNTRQPSRLGAFSHRLSEVLPFPPLPEFHRRQSDLAVVTWVAGEEAYKWFSVTGPAMGRYARRVGADLVVLEGYTCQPHYMVNKFRVKQVFDEYGYELVLFVDADALIQEHCLDFFRLVPQNHVAILDEGCLYDEWATADYRREACELATSQGLALAYSRIPGPKNSGLYLMPSCHRASLTPFAHPFPLCSRGGATVEQTWFGLRLQHLEVPIFDLRYPEHHWLWYSDQEERATDGAMVLHFAGLMDEGDVRYKRLVHHASKSSMPTMHPALQMANSFDRQMMLDPPTVGALNLVGAYTIDTHRYGWSIAVQALATLADDAGPILFDGFVESSFLYHAEECEKAGVVPYKKPWLGIIHNPPGVPEWPSIIEYRIQNLGRSILWQESLPHCIGLFTLSDYLADWVRREWGVRVNVLRYPTITPVCRFSMTKFLQTSPRVVTNIGFWLRRFSSFRRLEARGYCKVQPDLMPAGTAASQDRIAAYRHDEWGASRMQTESPSPVRRIPRLSNDSYDQMLGSSVVFLDLIDASAVTTVVECMVRGTPLVINRLPALVEYLGEDYPLYYDSIEEADSKLSDLDLIARGSEHMLRNPLVVQLSPQSFLNALVETELYQTASRISGRPT